MISQCMKHFCIDKRRWNKRGLLMLSDILSHSSWTSTHIVWFYASFCSISNTFMSATIIAFFSSTLEALRDRIRRVPHISNIWVVCDRFETKLVLVKRHFIIITLLFNLLLKLINFNLVESFLQVMKINFVKFFTWLFLIFFNLGFLHVKGL